MSIIFKGFFLSLLSLVLAIDCYGASFYKCGDSYTNIPTGEDCTDVSITEQKIERPQSLDVNYPFLTEGASGRFPTRKTRMEIPVSRTPSYGAMPRRGQHLHRR